MDELTKKMRELEEENKLLRSFRDISRILVSSDNVDEILLATVKYLTQFFNAERATIFLIDEGKRELWSKVAIGLESEEIRVKTGQGIAGQVAMTGETIISNDVYNDSRFNSGVDSKTGFTTRSMICVPIYNYDGDMIGVGQILNKKEGYFTDYDVNQLNLLLPQIAICLMNSVLHAILSRHFNSVMHVLAASIDARDPLTAGHSERVTEYSVGICKELNLPEKDCEVIRVAALLHDYGKIGVEDSILKKRGGLTDEEYDEIKSHAAKTKKILEEVGFEGIYRNVPEIAAAHHEKLDGSGYPEGLIGKDIPLNARIIAVADVFEAITSVRHYRSPMSYDEAFAILREGIGKHFQEDIVEAFIRYFKREHLKSEELAG
ncbi:MAG: HD domain-containing protein [Thermodesulfobacteriota bacterium]|nr:HD domain-containing protein [Thermodesulfobacteriota bacterium]